MTTVYVDNTNVLQLDGLQDAIDSSYINDADVTFSLVDKDAAELDGQTWPADMDYVATSNGNYRGFIENDVELVAGQTYRAIIEVDAGTNRIGHYEFPFVPKIRTKV